MKPLIDGCQLLQYRLGPEWKIRFGLKNKPRGEQVQKHGDRGGKAKMQTNQQLLFYAWQTKLEGGLKRVKLSAAESQPPLSPLPPSRQKQPSFWSGLKAKVNWDSVKL